MKALNLQTAGGPMLVAIAVFLAVSGSNAIAGEQSPSPVSPEPVPSQEVARDTGNASPESPLRVAENASAESDAPVEVRVRVDGERSGGTAQGGSGATADSVRAAGTVADRTVQSAAPRREGDHSKPEQAGDRPRFPVSRLVLEYAYDETRGLPELNDVLDAVVELGKTAEGYVEPGPGTRRVTLPLRDLGGSPAPLFSRGALLQVFAAIVDYFNERCEIYGVYVTADSRDISEQRAENGAQELLDHREPGDAALRAMIFVGRVTKLRTLASGERFTAEGERLNNPSHIRLLEDSPVRPYREGEDERIDLLNEEALDEYVLLKSRHPGRRVDVAVARAEASGEVALDFAVREAKPWMVYHQTSNTGTEETGEWRQRFGLIHNQLTGHDDILTLDYITSAFSTSHAASVSYEAPFFDCDRLRWSVYGEYSEFSASEVGQASETFHGRSRAAGATLSWNFFQHRELFMDLLAGLRRERIYVRNELIDVEGEADLWLPSVGLRLERFTDTESTRATVNVEWLEESWGEGTQRDELPPLGRLFPDGDWVVVSWDAAHSFYLEPLLNAEDWKDPSTPASSTLAHEIHLAFRGQHALGHRLIPQKEAVIGGLFSVRGYPESVVAGDNAYVGTAEYRFHVPRIFPVSEPGKLLNRDFRNLVGDRFRLAPQRVYGRPDWDLVLKAFFDVGKAHVSEARPFEHSRTLMSGGIGMDLVVKRNFSVRLDYAIAMREIDGTKVDAGEQRLHVLATLLF